MKAFDKVYKQYNQFMKIFHLYKLEELEKHFKVKENDVVIDIGGGTGYIAQVYSKKCKKIYVLDESEKMLSKVPSSENIITKVGNALDIPFEDNSMDAVLLTDVFHHIKEQKQLIEEINRILKKDGKLCILDFNKNHIKTKILRIFEHAIFGKLYFKTKEEIISIIETKFIIEKIADYDNYFIIIANCN